MNRPLIKHPFSIFNVIIALMFSLISGCAQQPATVVTEDKTQLNRVAKAAIAQFVYINTLLDTCAKLGDKAELEAVTVQQDWLEKNRTTSIAADSYYSDQLKDETVNYNGRDLALAAVLLSHTEQNRAINELGLKQRTNTNQQKTCVRRIQKIASEEMALSQDPQTLTDLQTLENKYTGDTRKVFSIPSLAGDIAINLEPGRSYFVLLEEFKRECPDARFITLHNQWPQEAYGTYCGEAPVSVIACEWGKCARG